MKKTFWFFIATIAILGFNNFNSFGQNTLIDSLVNRLPETSEEDRVKTLILLSYHHLRISTDKSLEYSLDALNYSEQTSNYRGVARASLMIGSAYNEKGEYSNALKNQQKALKIFKEIGDTAAIGITHNNLGMNYHNLGRYEEAIIQYQSSYDIALQLNNQFNLYYSLINMGIIYDEWKNYPLAIEYYRNALTISLKTRDQSNIGIAYQNIGYVHYEMKNYDSALYYFNKTLAISEKTGDKTGLFKSYINSGEVYFELEDYNSALNNYKNALLISMDVENKTDLTLSSLKLGETFLQLRNIEKAENHLLKALSLAKETGDSQYLKDIYYTLSNYYNQTSDFEKAYQNYVEFSTLKDTIFDRESRHEISEMQTLYELDKKENEIEIQDLKIGKQQAQYYYTISGVALLLILIVLVFNRYKLKQKQYRTELEKKNIDIEQRLLRTQMNPHFIFNSLNSINSFITDNNSDSAQSFLSKFARLMRYILENSRKTMVPVEDEINTLKLNIELEQLRFDNKFDFQIDIDENIDTEFTYIPPMLIQPFIENAIIHGLSSMEKDGFLKVDLRIKKKLIHCYVEDNGIGRKKAGKIKAKSAKAIHQSLGMQVTQERLEILNEKTKEEVNLKISDLIDKNGNPSGTRVDLKIPFEVE